MGEHIAEIGVKAPFFVSSRWLDHSGQFAMKIGLLLGDLSILHLDEPEPEPEPDLYFDNIGRLS
ncbi:hypothetical protein PHISCL_04988 [Aspergillus sclerotialis]|uniref:Uncharacterized protein n=1 Tax=Aspergillus sclerotialis TaxID=2070753 RepID=A0A3A2ZXF7_9EURO|nr:hypothetical protein PHISCL_04988 [Aspergillus sclerotialis]